MGLNQSKDDRAMSNHLVDMVADIQVFKISSFFFNLTTLQNLSSLGSSTLTAKEAVEIKKIEEATDDMLEQLRRHRIYQVENKVS